MISGIKCEFAVQLSRRGDWFTDKKNSCRIRIRNSLQVGSGAGKKIIPDLQHWYQGRISGSWNKDQHLHLFSWYRYPSAVLRSLRIRDPVPFWLLDPGSGMGKKPGIPIRDEQPGSYSECLETIFLGKNTLNLWSRIRDGKNSDPGWKTFGSGINIPDTQHCPSG